MPQSPRGFPKINVKSTSTLAAILNNPQLLIQLCSALQAHVSSPEENDVAAVTLSAALLVSLRNNLSKGSEPFWVA